jgi:type VI protein secretion system component VasK
MRSIPMKVRTRRILLIAGGLWLILMAYFYPRLAETNRQRKSFDRTFDEYASALVRQRYDEAYAQCGSVLRQATPHDKFVLIYRSLEEQYGPLKSYKLVGYHVVGYHGSGESTPVTWSGDLDAKFFYEKKTLSFEFVLHKENDRWVLFSVEQR